MFQIGNYSIVVKHCLSCRFVFYSGCFHIKYLKKLSTMEQKMIRTVAFAFPQSSSHVKPGVYKCDAKKCDCCSTYMIGSINNFTSTTKNKTHQITDMLTCKTSDVIYVIQCARPECKKQYVGKTTSALKSRFSVHKRAIRYKQNTSVAEHFNNNNHCLDDVTIFPIEQISDKKALGEREMFWIRELGTESPDGLNLDVTMEEGKKRKHAGDFAPPNKKQKVYYEAEESMNHCYEMEEEARNIISQVCEKLQNVRYSDMEDREDVEFLNKLIKETSNLKDKNLKNKIYIGVFGKTGAGKSSLINALVNERELLPASTSGACTACFIEVQAHEKATYKAEIDFITKEDWKEELLCLVENCQQNTEDGESENEDSEDEDSEDDEYEMAKAKIKAVYGEIGLRQTYDELQQLAVEIPNTHKKTITSNSACDLSREISDYIRSDTESQQYWPLVKKVTVYVPGSSVLLDRIVLVDLPGAGDANKCRDQMWKEYLGKCSSVWIVNDITRAISDKTAMEIQNTTIRNVAGGGECHNITYICTKSDNIDPHHLIRQYNLTDEELGITISNDKKVKNKCILFRNNKVKELVKKNFNEKTKKKLLGTDVNSTEFFKVFTVSSADFWNNEEKKEHILDRDETELPALKEHIKDLYVSHSQKAVKDYVSQVSGIVSFLHIPKENTSTQTEDLKDKLFSELKQKFETRLQDLAKFFDGVYTKMTNNLDEGVKNAEKQCLINALKVLKPKKTKYSGYHKTLKALCRCSGYYRSRDGKIVDLNYALVLPMYAAMDNSFVSCFRLNQNSRSSIKGAFDLLQNDLIIIDKRKHAAVELRLTYIKTELRILIADLETEVIARKKNIYNSITQSVQDTMDPAYKDGAVITGSELVTRIQSRLEEHVESYKLSMFREAKKRVMFQFKQLKDYVIHTLKKEMGMSMKLALTQFPTDVTFPDVEDELKKMKGICKALELDVFQD
ncbi:nuclear GTPase SLIP-GC-like isoform X2 [Acipenser ruthenus]|uniref:nuclear GTPase SLIP-GC-like isoform X2 n=1 Tax=Acipenser ruthenus TaxID=7906 RepID=UPI002741A637|nr:nuclear GTPase SLIP-GC-like isoform X2 [Acipenser ruthenus]